MRNVLIAGSLREASGTAFDHFKTVCNELGSEFAGAGWGLVIGSTRDQTADAHVAQGYLERGGPEILLVTRADEERDSAERLLAGGRRTHVDVERLGAVDRAIWRLREVRRADAVLLIGGANGTKQILELCSLQAKPCFGLPTFGLVGQAAYNGLIEHGDTALVELARRAYENPAHAVELLSHWMDRPPAQTRVRDSELEPHVAAAFEVASQARPLLDSAAVLLAFLAIQTQGAFQRLQSIFRSRNLSLPDPIRAFETKNSVFELEPSFGRALRLARCASPERKEVWGRTAVTAALFDPALAGRTEIAARHLEGIRSAWVDFLSSEKGEPRAWLEVIEQIEARQGKSGGGPTAVQVHSALAGFGADDVPSEILPEHDDLKFSAEVNALAAVIAARDVKPPLSVGLFGNWGVGKSFFMRQMRSRIKALADAAEVCEVSRGKKGFEREPAFWSDIAQIEFNAWHYTDANLWASLVARIFGGLRDHLDARHVENPEEILTKELEELTGQAERLKKLEEDERQKANDYAAELAAVDTALAKVDGIKVASSVAGQLLQQLERQPELGKIMQSAGAAIALKDAAELEKAARELTTTAKRVQTKAALMWRGRYVLVAAAVLCLVVLGMTFLIETLARESTAFEQFKGLASKVVSLATGLVSFTLTLTKQAEGGLDRIGGALATAEQDAKKERKDQDPAYRAAERNLSESRQKADGTRKALEEVRARKHLVENEIVEMRSGRRFQKFIESRAKSADYNDKLSIISIIRADFENLSNQLAKTSKKRRARWSQKGGAEEKVEASGTGGETQVNHVREIDRIVLYIDDLDRCPPARVVEVLQAVHLLLAFPLFVVVVAVDSRWLLRSLLKEYPDFLEVETTPSGLRAPPHHYLEKIFQVAFSVRPLDRDGHAALLKSLCSPAGSKESGGSAQRERKVTDVGQDHSGAVKGNGAGTVNPQEKKGGDSSVKDPEPLVEREPTIELNPPTLEVSDVERGFMAELHVLFETPRSVKRFVNTYRILKVTYADKVAGDEDRFAIATVLAILVGRPLDAPGFFERVGNQRGSVSFEQFLDALKGDEVPSLAELGRTLGALDRPRRCSIDAVRKWIPKVARFSVTPIRIDDGDDIDGDEPKRPVRPAPRSPSAEVAK